MNGSESDAKVKARRERRFAICLANRQIAADPLHVQAQRAIKELSEYVRLLRELAKLFIASPPPETIDRWIKNFLGRVKP